jgi:hypothetical protein
MSNTSKTSAKAAAKTTKTSSRKSQSAPLRNILADVVVSTPDGASFDLRLAVPIDTGAVANAGADRGFKAGKDL